MPFFLRPFAVVGLFFVCLFASLGSEGCSREPWKEASKEAGSETSSEGWPKEADASPDLAAKDEFHEGLPDRTPDAIADGHHDGISQEAPPDGSAEKPEGSQETIASETSNDTTPLPWADPTIHQGKATFYDADGSGNCSFPPISQPMVAAMNQDEYGDAAFCGACIRVSGPQGSVVVKVTDRCPECKKGHLDLSRQAFAKIADPKLGVVPISWQVIACDIQGPLQFFYKDGSSQWWTAIQIREHRLPLRSLELWKGGAWKILPRQQYNFFLESTGAGDQPLRLRLTAWDGRSLEEIIAAPASERLILGKQQF